MPLPAKPVGCARSASYREESCGGRCVEPEAKVPSFMAANTFDGALWVAPLDATVLAPVDEAGIGLNSIGDCCCCCGGGGCWPYIELPPKPVICGCM